MPTDQIKFNAVCDGCMELAVSVAAGAPTVTVVDTNGTLGTVTAGNSTTFNDYLYNGNTATVSIPDGNTVESGKITGTIKYTNCPTPTPAAPTATASAQPTPTPTIAPGAASKLFPVFGSVGFTVSPGTSPGNKYTLTSTATSGQGNSASVQVNSANTAINSYVVNNSAFDVYLDLKIGGTTTTYTIPANGGVISRNDTLVVAFSDSYKIRTDPDTFTAGSVVGYVATI